MSRIENARPSSYRIIAAPSAPPCPLFPALPNLAGSVRLVAAGRQA
jgi:hypothetical protein